MILKVNFSILVCVFRGTTLIFPFQFASRSLGISENKLQYCGKLYSILNS